MLKNIDGQLGKLGTTSGLAGAAITAGIGAALVGAGGLVAGLGYSVKAAGDFEQSLANMAAATGATKGEIAAMRKEALGIGKDTSLSASQAAAAMTELSKAGMATETIVGGAARSVVQLAEATGANVSDMAILVSNSLNTFGEKAGGAAAAANLIARAANASAIDTSDFATSLAAVGPVASQAGLSMQDFGVAIGLMGNHALTGSDAGTSLKTMLLSLTAPTDAAKGALDQLGVSVFDSAGKTRPFRDVIGDLQTALAGATDAQRAQTLETIFGRDAIRAANILVGEGTTGWDGFIAKMAEAPGVAEQSRTRLATLSGQIEMLKGSLETIAINIGTLLLPSLTRLATGANAGLAWLIDQDWSEASGNLTIVFTNVKNIAGAVLQLAGIDFQGAGSAFMSFVNGATGALAGFSSRIAEAFFDKVIPGFKAFKAGSLEMSGIIDTVLDPALSRLIGMSATFTSSLALTNPPLAALVFALGLLALAYKENFGGMRDTVDGFIKGQIVPAFVSMGKTIDKTLRGDFKGASDEFVSNLGNMHGKTTEKIRELSDRFLKWIPEIVLPGLPVQLVAVWEALSTWIGNTARDLPDQLLVMATEFTAWLGRDVVPSIGGELQKFLDTILVWVRNDENMAAISTALDHWVASFLGFIEFQVVPRLGPEVLKLALALGKEFLAINAKITEIGLRLGASILTGIGEGLVRNAEAVLGTALRNALKLAFPALSGMIDSVFSKGGSSGGFDTSGTGTLKGPDGKSVPIPKMAAGGIVTGPTLAMIGEAGPEAVIPLGKSGGMGTSVNFYGPVYGFADFQDKVVEALTGAERRGRIRPGTMAA